MQPKRKKQDEQHRKFTCKDIIARDKTSLDIFWIRDKSLADLANLPDPDVLAERIRNGDELTSPSRLFEQERITV